MTVDLRCGNALDVLRTMPDESVHCVVTSPPYWGLRAYGTEPQVWQNGHDLCVEHQWGESLKSVAYKAGNKTPSGEFQNRPGWAEAQAQYGKGNCTAGNTCTICGAWRGELGLEPTPELYVAHLVQIFREVRRVLRDDGTLWLNLGDSYVGGKGANNHRWSIEHQERETLEKPHHHLMIETGRPCDNMRNMEQSGLKPKDLVGIPWMVAFALRADGWYLRSDIIWHKPNPMPESVRDRPTKAHEYIFLLAKSPKYYYDADAIAEPASMDSGFAKQRLSGKGKWSTKNCGRIGAHPGGNESGDGEWVDNGKRNRRSVWTVTTKPYRQAHFATYPPDLITPCVLAGTSERGVCPKCGAPWERVIEKGRLVSSGPNQMAIKPRGFRQNQRIIQDLPKDPYGDMPRRERTTTGWQPTCTCGAGEPVPAIVMDIFNGAGTTGVVAVPHNRNYIGIDLNPAYIEMAQMRIQEAESQIAMGV